MLWIHPVWHAFGPRCSFHQTPKTSTKTLLSVPGYVAGHDLYHEGDVCCSIGLLRIGSPCGRRPEDVCLLPWRMSVPVESFPRGAAQDVIGTNDLRAARGLSLDGCVRSRRRRLSTAAGCIKSFPIADALRLESVVDWWSAVHQNLCPTPTSSVKPSHPHKSFWVFQMQVPPSVLIRVSNRPTSSPQTFKHKIRLIGYSRVCGTPCL